LSDATSRPPAFLDTGFEALWRHTLDHWQDEKAHTAFLQYAEQHNLLAEAAARYRGMTGDHTRAELAEKKLAAVAVLAIAKLESQRSERAAPTNRLVLIAVGLVAFTAIALLYLFLRV
jgi:hypothetical protein